MSIPILLTLVRRFHLKTLSAVALGLAVFTSAEAQAGLVLGATSTNVVAGSLGNVLDVTLTNTGPDEVLITAFSFELYSPSTDVTFTDSTNGTTVPYIFAGDSFADAFPPFGDITSPQSGPQDIIASDATFSGMAITLGSTQTVALGHVFFDVASTAPPGPITLSFPDDMITSILTADNTQINLTGSAEINIVPEPGSIVMVAQALLFLGYFGRRKLQRSNQRQE